MEWATKGNHKYHKSNFLVNMVFPSRLYFLDTSNQHRAAAEGRHHVPRGARWWHPQTWDPNRGNRTTSDWLIHVEASGPSVADELFTVVLDPFSMLRTFCCVGSSDRLPHIELENMGALYHNINGNNYLVSPVEVNTESVFPASRFSPLDETASCSLIAIIKSYFMNVLILLRTEALRDARCLKGKVDA